MRSTLASETVEELGFAPAAADERVARANGHVGINADVATPVHTILPAAGEEEVAAAHDPKQNAALAKQALVQLGFPAAIADEAVRAAKAHVGTEVSVEVHHGGTSRHFGIAGSTVIEEPSSARARHSRR